MKCPQCGLVTFDDLPQCPRCKESFALVRPLASASVDGARHVLRDDPELRLKLRDRLHRARIHRRKQNENPLATGPDPDAPDWFAPDSGADNGAAEAGFALEPAAGERGKETEIVNFDDLSPDDDVRGGATTADADNEAGIIEASREPESAEAPEFAGDIPGFTDWREELRERLKRIRARREQERLTAEAEAADLAAAAEQQAIADEQEAIADQQQAIADVAGSIEEPLHDRAVEIAAASDVDATATGTSSTADTGEEGSLRAATAGDLIAQIVDGASAGRAPGEADGGRAPLDIDGELDSYAASDNDGIDPVARDAVDFDAIDVDSDDALEVDLEIGGEGEDSPEFDFELSDRSAGTDLDALDLSSDASQVDVGAVDAAGELDMDDGAAELDTPRPDDVAAAELGGAMDPDTVAPARRPVFSWGATPPGATVPGLERETDEARQDDAAADPSVPVEAAESAQALDADDRTIPDESTASSVTAEGIAAPAGNIDATTEGADERVAEATAVGEATAAPDEGAAAPADDEVPHLVENASTDDEGDSTDDDGPQDEEADAAPDADAPELDFDDEAAAIAAAPALQIDVDAEQPDADRRALEWDDEEHLLQRNTRSSAGPLGERAAAALCDLLVLTAIGAALVGAAASGTELPFRQVLVEETLWLGMAWAIFAIGYSVFLVGSCGQTIGRMVMRLRVVGNDQFSVGFDRAAIRLAAWLVSALPLLAGMIPALKDPQHRGLHDRLSHTRVVKA